MAASRTCPRFLRDDELLAEFDALSDNFKSDSPQDAA
jgi:hypothetical protein